jgi:hypothetical protein
MKIAFPSTVAIFAMAWRVIGAQLRGGEHSSLPHAGALGNAVSDTPTWHDASAPDERDLVAAVAPNAVQMPSAAPAKPTIFVTVTPSPPTKKLTKRPTKRPSTMPVKRPPTAAPTARWADGKVCALGSTCSYCQNPATYWPTKSATACGKDPCWTYRTICGAGTTCNNCCNGYSWKLIDFFTSCN